MKLLLTSALLLLTISSLAQAKHNRHYQNNDQYSRGEYKAKVIDSTPVYSYVTVRQPQTYCEPEMVVRTHRQSHDKSAAIVGGIVGGMIGHAASNNKHQGFGTLVGAVIGSSLVHNIAHANNNHSQNNRVQRQNCVVKYNRTSKVRVLDGYRVTYRSKGKIYRTFRQDKPAKYIRINY